MHSLGTGSLQGEEFAASGDLSVSVWVSCLRYVRHVRIASSPPPHLAVTGARNATLVLGGERCPPFREVTVH